ncbi:MAG TPA: SBBP repeat-containing protein [Acidobacteriota bacterium]|nr:SBBP repeat-containing protein [Acidobacteriota bacterium]
MNSKLRLQFLTIAIVLSLVSSITMPAFNVSGHTSSGKVFAQTKKQNQSTGSQQKPESTYLGESQTKQTLGGIPMYFEENDGQVHSAIKYFAKGSGYSTYLTQDEVVVALPTDEQLHLKMVNATANPNLIGQDQKPGKLRYISGNDPRQWQNDVSTFGKVSYQNVYPGIDAVFYGTNRQLEYDFIVAPGSNPQAIALAFTGAKSVKIDSKGELVLKTRKTEIRQSKPVVYQTINGTRQEIAGNYIAKGNNTIGFQLGTYDLTQPLVIDPVILNASSYLGGSGDETNIQSVVDSSGNVFITGKTTSKHLTCSGGDFPIQNQVTTPSGTFFCGSPYQHMFISRVDRNGNLIYSTFFGSFNGAPNDIDVDNSGNVYVVGTYLSGNPFPEFNDLGTDYLAHDAFIVKLDAGGNCIYSTRFGGNGSDFGLGITADTNGNAYITGNTSGSKTNFPLTANAYQTNGPIDSNSHVFVAKIAANAGPNGVLYCSYLGDTRPNNVSTGATLVRPSGARGSRKIIAYGDAGDEPGAFIYVTGYTNTPNLKITSGAIQNTFGGGNDIFVARLYINNPNAASIVTYLGGDGDEYALDMVVDSNHQIYLTGYNYRGGTSKVAFPTTSNAYQQTQQGPTDAIVVKISTNVAGGNTLAYSSLLGGMGTDSAHALAVDSNGLIYITGEAGYPSFPTTANAFKTTYTNADAFVSQIDPSQSGSASLVYSSLLGGNGLDTGYGIALGGRESNPYVYILGQTYSNNATFPAKDAQAPVNTHVGNSDIFVARFDLLNSGANSLTHVAFIGGTAFDGVFRTEHITTFAIGVDSVGYAYFSGHSVSTNYPVVNPFDSGNSNSSYEAVVGKLTF